MEYALFVILTATLFLRPAELVPALAGLPIYNYVMLACLVTTAPRIAHLLQKDQLGRLPISCCVLGMLVAAALSHMVRLDLYSTRTYSIDFAKILVFYFLVVAAIDSRQRLQQYLYWIALFTIVLCFLAVGHYHEYFHIEALDAVRDWDVDPATGERVAIYRLRATGIFQDPNDLCMIIVASMCICAMGFFNRFRGPLRFLWLIPIVFLGYTLMLTQSRGGFLAMIAAGGSLIYSRFGLKKTLIVGAIMLPLVGVLFGGRQTDISGALSGGTGEGRVELWSVGLQALKGSPLFGIGFRQYASEAGQVAHNSYVHCLVDLGIVGGSVFIGAFWLAARIMWALGNQRRWMTMLTGSQKLAYLHPFLIAILVGYMASMLSLSRGYVIPTYLILGLIAAYENVAFKHGVSSKVRLDGREIGRILGISILYLLVTYIYIRVGFR